MSQYCPMCNTVVAEGDREAIRGQTSTYHRHCWQREQRRLAEQQPVSYPELNCSVRPGQRYPTPPYQGGRGVIH